MGAARIEYGQVGLGRSVLMDEAYEALVSLVIDGGLPPGAPLRIDTLAREWGVSPTPLREALAKLASTGLIVHAPHKGYAVAPLLTDEEFHELMAARLLIEPYSARNACARDATGTAAVLDDWHARMTAAATARQDQEEFREYLRADAAFHEAIAEAAGNRFLSRAVDPLGAHVQRFRRFHGSQVTDADEALAEHRAVLDAFHAADPEACATAMQAHLEGVAGRAAVRFGESG